MQINSIGFHENTLDFQRVESDPISNSEVKGKTPTEVEETRIWSKLFQKDIGVRWTNSGLDILVKGQFLAPLKPMVKVG